jgi:hypothetical protein
MENEAKKQKKICTPEETLQPLNVTDVVSVYEGEVGGCWCCAGKHFYNPALVEQIAEYVSEGLLIQPKPEQFNQEKVAFITEFVNRHIDPRNPHGDDGATEFWDGGLYILELNRLKYRVRTTADYAFRREILNAQRQIAGERTFANQNWR